MNWFWQYFGIGKNIDSSVIQERFGEPFPTSAKSTLKEGIKTTGVSTKVR